MRKPRRHLMAIALVVATAAFPGGSAFAASKATYYLSLGDSLATGNQPIGSGPDSQGTQGYAEQLFKAARGDEEQLRLVKLGCSGETSSSLIRGVGSPCAYPLGSQLAEAVSFLQGHAGQVAFITIDIGANDVLGACFDPETGVLDPSCTAEVMPTVQANIVTILDALEDAAPGVPIAGMNFYNPFLGFWTLIPGPVGESLARLAAEANAIHNAATVQTFQDGGALVADVAGAFDVGNFTDTAFVKGFGVVPVNVASACNWTWFCGLTPGPPITFDPHPNTEGYGVIAEAFEEVLWP